MCTNFKTSVGPYHVTVVANTTTTGAHNITSELKKSHRRWQCKRVSAKSHQQNYKAEYFLSLCVQVEVVHFLENTQNNQRNTPTYFSLKEFK